MLALGGGWVICHFRPSLHFNLSLLGRCTDHFWGIFLCPSRFTIFFFEMHQPGLCIVVQMWSHHQCASWNCNTVCLISSCMQNGFKTNNTYLKCTQNVQHGCTDFPAMRNSRLLVSDPSLACPLLCESMVVYLQINLVSYFQA